MVMHTGSVEPYMRHFSSLNKQNFSVAPVQSATSWLEVSEMVEKNVKVPEEVLALKKASSGGSRSSVWEHFSDPTAEKRTTCKHCKGSYKYTGGTTNLINHLKSSHPAFVGGNSIFKQAAKVELSDIERTVFGTKPIGAFGSPSHVKGLQCHSEQSNHRAYSGLDRRRHTTSWHRQ